MMSLAFVKLVLTSKPALIMRLLCNLKELYRAGFVSTAVSEGVYGHLGGGARSAEQLFQLLDLKGDVQQLESWLDLGVSLGELKKEPAGYAIKSSFSKKMAAPENDTALAFYQARVEVFFRYITQTIGQLRDGGKFPLDDSYGELFARSSRTVEPILLEIVDRVVPKASRMLEVGCGSGVYIRRACQTNPGLEVVGLELSAASAQFASDNLCQWGYSDRTTVANADVRQFNDEQRFDLLTFYNLIYYFPMEQRPALLRHLYSLLRPGGRMILTTLTLSGNDPSTHTMNLWSSMTEGCGPLPQSDILHQQLQAAGFAAIRQKSLLGNYQLFDCSVPAH